MSTTDEQAVDTTASDKAVEAAEDPDQVLAAFHAHAAAIAVEDPEAVQERILRNLLTATTAADILRAGEALPASALYGTALRIKSIRASESTFADGPKLYLHVDADIVSNGDAVTFSCGATDVCMKLIRLDQLGLLPCLARIEQATKATADGFFPVFLRALDDAGEPF